MYSRLTQVTVGICRTRRATIPVSRDSPPRTTQSTPSRTRSTRRSPVPISSSMKGAVEVLTRYLAKELGPRRIAVNTVAPGAIATDFSGGMVRDNPDINRRVSEMTALGRAGVADDIGPMIASLLSEENRWVNGQRIEVSGGMAL